MIPPQNFIIPMVWRDIYTLIIKKKKTEKRYLDSPHIKLELTCVVALSLSN